MSDLHSETAPQPCANAACTCTVPKGTGYREDGRVYCNAQCADPSIKGCGHEGCPCNNVAL